VAQPGFLFGGGFEGRKPMGRKKVESAAGNAPQAKNFRVPRPNFAKN